MLNNIFDVTIQWVINHGIKVAIIFIAAFIILRILKIVIKKALKTAVEKTYENRDGKALEKRTATLETVFYSTIKIVIWTIAFLMIISEFGINVGPVLAAVGVAGLAFGFGAQYLIRDLISGLFIILEDQYRKDDVIKINNTTGVVEDINLRKTIIRDLDGTEHHVPNGEIKMASNLSKGWSRVNLNIGVSYDTDLEKAIRILNEIGEKITKDKNWKDIIIKAPQVLGVNKFAESAIEIKVLGETKPGEHWNVARELRKRIKKTFDEKGIEIPFPHMVIIQK